ncbi:MAG: serine/threonine protein kinase [Sandaracinaceae bacterium]|nr:serine/threonine protein kinase [Sandaracinaceae bacterium]
MRTSATRRSQDHLGTADTVDSTPRSGGRSLPTGTLLEGAYRIEELIGRGGMGAVYRAEHITLGRQFAVKVVGAEALINKESVTRLVQEARTASSIEHENIIDVTHLGTDPDTGLVFVVMELLRGEDLRARLVRHGERGGHAWLDDDDVRRLAPQFLSALAAAHSAGIIHRDLKPENVFLAKKRHRELVKVLDFGMSKIAVEDESMRLTKTGQIIGTPLYMAPEQSRDGALVDARADVYSLGVMLYELLSGEVPFPAETVYSCIMAHATVPPPPLGERRPDLPEPVVDLVHRCLEKDPARRYEDGAELLAAWEAAWSDAAPLASSHETDQFAAITDRTSTPAAEPARPSRPWWAIALVAVALLAVGGWLYASTREPAVVTPPPVAAPEAPTPEPVVVAEPPAPEPPPEPEPPPAPTVRTVTITSTPSGATVREGDQVLGTTPRPIEVTEGAPPRALVVQLRGRRDAPVELDDDSPDTVEVTLRPVATRGASADDLAGW